MYETCIAIICGLFVLACASGVLPCYRIVFHFISTRPGPCTRDIRRHCWGVKAKPEAFLDCLTTRVKNEKAGNEIPGERAMHVTECRMRRRWMEDEGCGRDEGTERKVGG